MRRVCGSGLVRVAGGGVPRSAGSWVAARSSGGPASSGAVPAGEQFGYRKVETGEKQRLVGEVFSSVASNYDVMNDLMSAGLHRLWKDDFVSQIGVPAVVAAEARSDGAAEVPLRFLDVAGGTGDIAFRIITNLDRAGAFQARPGRPAAEVTISDINGSMLGVGEKRAAERFSPELLDHVSFVEANAETLPFEDNSFDVYTIAFGLRNVTKIDQALKDALRVLKPGGRFLCLEFSHVHPAPLRQLYDLYSFNLIPPIGQLVAGDRNSYQYLVESIRLFPNQQKLCRRMQDAGFESVSYEDYTQGVVAVHSGFKPLRE